MICGNIPHVLNGMPHRKRFKLQPQKGLKPEEVYQWIEDAGLEICGKSGIRSFSDYIGNMEYMGDYQFEDVLELEKQLCRQEPYLSLGRYIHVWAQNLRNNSGECGKRSHNMRYAIVTSPRHKEIGVISITFDMTKNSNRNHNE